MVLNADRQKSFPVLLFTPEGDLIEERYVLAALDAIPDLENLRRAFFSKIRRDQADFLAFCASSTEKPDYRIYTFERLGPFRAAFCEQNVLDGTRLIFVYLAPKLTALYRLMSPASYYYKDAVTRILFEWLALRDGGSPEFTSLSPEAFLTISRVPHLAEALFSPRCGTRLCDLGRLMRLWAETVGAWPDFTGCAIRYDEKDAAERKVSAYDAFQIVDVPVEALVCAMSLVIRVLRSAAAADAISVTLSAYGQAREVAFRVKIPPELLSDPFADSFEDAGLSALFALPEAYHRAVHVADLLCRMTRIDAAVRRDASELCAAFRLNAEAPSVLDFKYSDPYAAVLPVTGEADALWNL